MDNIDVLLGSPTRNGQVYVKILALVHVNIWVLFHEHVSHDSYGRYNLCLSLSPKKSEEKASGASYSICDDAISQQLNFSTESSELQVNNESALVLMIPVEVLLNILRHVPPQTLGCLRRVCTRYYTPNKINVHILIFPQC